MRSFPIAYHILLLINIGKIFFEFGIHCAFYNELNLVTCTKSIFRFGQGLDIKLCIQKGH